ncbi:lysin B [Mycobacterium phage TelAviv]|nr:lysin B [Mycobacterium phage JangDynasty]AVP42722.1 lysin B [Mycobacterium phage SchoolBus]QPO16552.1 lysin B [Mycobacterium phage TelAviv]
MRIGGEYVGLGLGDASEEIGRIRDFMRRKFRSYAGNLPDTRNALGLPLFDEPMTVAVTEMQGRYLQSGELRDGLFIFGIINAETKYVMGYLERPPGPDTRPLFITVCGTGVPWWVGPDADTARACEDKLFWQPIGYPAKNFPMGKSIAAGIDQCHVQFNRADPGFMHRQRIERNGVVLGGYSQGAVVVSELWENNIKPANGSLHWAKDYVVKAVTWGNPNREAGAVWPDYGGSPMASLTSQGVSSTGMRDTPSWWRNYAHAGDLYAAAEPGDSQQDKNAIWQIIRDLNFFTGTDSLLAQAIELSQMPIPRTIAAFKALIDAGMFFAKGTGPHVDYGIGPAIEYLRS